jgi:hypothetical protein
VLGRRQIYWAGKMFLKKTRYSEQEGDILEKNKLGQKQVVKEKITPKIFWS